MVRFLSLVCFCAATLPLVELASAQTGTSSLQGVVQDPSGAAVADAKISLVNTAQAFQREGRTNRSGEYKLVSVPPGTYNLAVEKEGFRKYEASNLRLLVDSPVTNNVTLEIGAITQRVEVSSQSETINTTNASIGNAFGETQIKQLPLESRNVPDLLSLQTGVVYTGNRQDVDLDTDTRSGSVNGARSDQSNVTLDGVSVNEKGGYAFRSVLPVTLDSVDEFRVTTTNYGADQGSAGGAQVTLITKSGTNALHGSAYEYNRNSYFSANDYFVKAAQLESGEPNKPPQLNRNIFGVSLGGPIKKDRLFYFLNYEGYRDAEAISALRTVPTATLRDGIIQYICQDPSACPGGTVTGISGKQYSYAGGGMALSPQQITAMDSGTPGPHGPDPVVLQYMNTYPLPNDFTTGDLLNTAGYRFRAPTYTVKNWYIGKLDYNITQDGRHRVSVSGALANESDAGQPFLPGTPPEQTTVNYNKGIIANYTASLTPTLLNDFRYGFIRQSNGIGGDSTQPWVYLAAIDQGITYSQAFQRPIHNFNDDVTSIHGKHTFQFGFQISLLRDHETNSNNSFSYGVTNPEWMFNSGLADKGVPLDPGAAANGYPAVAQNFNTSYDYSLTSMLGMVTFVNANYNYQRNGQPLAQGVPVARNFAEDSYEMYAQDTWKVKPNLTLTYGLRYSLFSPPWETNGLEVTPTESLNTWFSNRANGMWQDIPSSAQPLVAYDWSGPANGKSGYYGWDYHDFAPRLSLAYSPGAQDGFLRKIFGGPDKTSIRAGFGVVYDRVGESLVDTFDQNGAFGLYTALDNPSDVQTSTSTPRLTSLNSIPTTDNTGARIFIPAPAANFPQPFPSTLATGGSAITWGIDDKLKTPYAYTLDFAISRQLSSSFSLDVAYVGRLSHRELAQDDLAMPLDIFDAKAGIDYFTAATALARIYRPELAAGNSAPTASFKPSQLPADVRQFWTDMIQPLAPGGAYTISGCTPNQTPAPTTSPVVAAFDLFCSTSLNESLALYNLDSSGIPDFNNPNRSYFPNTGQYTYYSPQYTSLFAWRSMANANYHAMEVTLRRQMTNGLQFDLNYTLSKSIDLASDAERVGPGSSTSSLNNIIINAWDPKQERAVSSFDVRHQINANWIYQLPLGRGKAIAGNAGGVLNAIIGGWQLSGLFRITSGFPVNVDNGYSNYPTNFQQEGNATLVTAPVTGKYTVQSGPDAGAINIFKDGPDAINDFTYTLPGQSGGRNQIRGQGYFGIDMGLAKRWLMPWSEKQSLQFRWEVFNITNSVRFDVQSSLLSSALTLGSSTSFGNYSGLLTNPRIMQLALRYEF